MGKKTHFSSRLPNFKHKTFKKAFILVNSVIGDSDKLPLDSWLGPSGTARISSSSREGHGGFRNSLLGSKVPRTIRGGRSRIRDLGR